MKTSPLSRSSVMRSSCIRRVLPVAVAVASSVLSAAEPAPAVAESKPYTLYMGADIEVERSGELYRVQDVSGSSFVISVDGKKVKVPTESTPSRFKVAPGLKLTERNATVTNFKSVRAYTLGNDPTVRFQRGLANAQLQYSDSKAAQAQASAAFHWGDPAGAAAAAAARADGHGPAPSPAAEGMAQDKVQLNFQSVAGAPGSTFHESGSPLDGEEMFDAMELSFDVTSTKPLPHPYVVVMARYRTADDLPGQTRNWVYARELPAIGSETTKVHFTQGGFPPGFSVQDFQVHLYEQGREIATSVAPNRVELSREEAFQYVMMEYIASHKAATIPVGPAVGRLPAGLSSRAADGQLQPTYFVKVTKDGKVSGVFTDKGCSRQADDPALVAAVNEMYFMPALEKGRPVEGVTQLKLN